MAQLKAIRKIQPEAKPLLHYPYVKHDLWLVDFRGAPFVPLKPVCDALGLNFKGQVSRLRRSKKPYGLKSVTATEDGKMLHLEAIPLENLTAFLFTLRSPSSPHLMILRSFERQIAKLLIFFWSRYQRDYVSPKAVAAELATLARLTQIKDEPSYPQDTAPQPTKCERVTPDVVEKIKKLKLDGMNISTIAKFIGCSRTTASQILSGKYKTVASGTIVG